MAHFAELDTNNVVLRVVVVHNNELLDENGIEQEAKGAAFCESLFGGKWVQTSYNGTIRKNFAGGGFMYDADRDAFVPPKPFNSWLLVDDTCTWEAPTTYPDDGGVYTWDEPTISWIGISDNE